MKKLSLDFETASNDDLTDTGASKYSKGGDLVVTVCAWGIDDSEVKSVTLPGRDGLPKEIISHIKKGGLITAWNASFEVSILRNYFGLEIEDKQVICTMQRAMYCGLPASLGDAGEALGVDHVKDKTARRLMMQMSKPRDAKTNTWWHETDPEKLEALRKYCEQDVRAERSIADAIPMIPYSERKVSVLDARINYHGVRLDRQAINAMITVAEDATIDLDDECAIITAGKVKKPGSRSQALVDYLKDYVTDLTKPSVAAALERTDLPPVIRRVLELRQLAAKTSTKKLAAMLDVMEEDDAARGCLQYYGASRTGRWAGRLVQPQNMPRPTIKDPDAAIAAAIRGEGVEAFGDPLDVTASCLRGMIVPREGTKFITLDLSQIEARVLPWIAGQQDVLDVFASGQDVYVHTAKKLGSDNRTLGKVLVLACGYGMGPDKFKVTADTYKLALSDDEAKAAVYAWREANDKITSLWQKAQEACFDAIEAPNTRYQIRKGVSVIVEDGVMKIRLPSKRELFYRDPQINDGEISYMGVNQKTRKWERLRSYGGKFVENIVQAVARDVIADMALRIDNISDANIVLSVHDEIVTEVPAHTAEDRYFEIEEIMSTPPAWADDLPVGCDGHIQDRYGKGGYTPKVGGEGAATKPLEPLSSTTACAGQGGDPTKQEILEEASDVVVAEHKGREATDQCRPNKQALIAALKLADAGIKVFPCRSDKRPVSGFMRWEQEASNDPDQIRAWFGVDYAHEAAMVGVPCGPNGLVAIDPDTPKPEKRKYANGVEAFAQLIAANEIDLAGVPVVETPSGGRHFIFAQPQEYSIHCSRGDLPESIDVKGVGGYIIGVGSVRDDGLAYKPFVGTSSLIEAYRSGTIPIIPAELQNIIGSKRPKLVTVDGEIVVAERMSIELLTSVLKEIENDAWFEPYDRWVEMAHAIKGACAGSDHGKELWLDWCSTVEQTDGEPERVWDSIKSPRMGAGYIRKEIERRGLVDLFEAAQHERASALFDDDDDDPDAPEVNRRDPSKNPFFAASYWAGERKGEKVEHIVKNLITAKGLTFIAGQRNAGKSAIAVNLAVALATGTAFAHRRVKNRCGVVYVAAEAPGSIPSRIGVAADAVLVEEGEILPIRIMPLVPDLADKAARKRFIDGLRMVVAKTEEDFQIKVGAIIIDTFARSFSMSDENSAAEMGAVVRAVEEIGGAVDAARVVVHHLGKNATAGMRGSSALEAAADDMLVATVDPDDRFKGTLVHEKSRNFEVGSRIGFRLSSIKIGEDEDGDDVTTVRAAFVDPEEDAGGECSSGGVDGDGAQDAPSALIRIMVKHPTETQRGWASRLDLPVTRVNRLLKDAVTAGYVKKRKGRHIVTLEGEKTLEEATIC